MAADVLSHQPRRTNATAQGSLTRRYPLWVQWLSMATFTPWLFLFYNPIWLNRFTEYALIFAFGLWRIRGEENPYTRKRLMVVVGTHHGLFAGCGGSLPFDSGAPAPSSCGC